MRSSNRETVSDMSNPSPSPILEEESDLDEFEICCEACDPEDQADVTASLHFCHACDVILCERCWRLQLQHRRKGKSTAIHEKSNPWVARQIQKILNPPTNEISYAQLCATDESTSWFGIDRGKRNNDPLYLKDTGRYAELMSQTRDENSIRFSWNSEADDVTAVATRDSRTPSLVSFVGQSGAGKSTLITLLSTFKSGADRSVINTPVVGMTGKDVPTSEDVHLYPDPASVYSSTPILYADCEGLDGGEREPVGTRFRKMRPNSPDARIRDSVPSDRPLYISSRELVWATEDSSRRTRNFAVANLYPRLLFSFSDTIVFVLRNPRVVESVFSLLLDWAAAALESASNQPILPAAIIALNATEGTIDDESWDVDSSTRNLLNSLASTVRENSTFKKHVDFWSCRGKQIDNLEELVLSYFSSIEIVRIPANRPRMLQIQVEKLYDAIDRGCQRARERKLSLRMLLNAGEMQSYLSHAFDHFSQTLDEAFDFVRASLSNSPIPLDFGGNILRLALNVMEFKTQAKQKIEARELFRELARMIASCIMLDSVRHEIRGNAERIFPEYLDHIHTALEDFTNHHWPCEFTITVGEYAQRMQHMHVMAFQRNLHVLNQRARCCNVRSGHGKGHQSRKGIVFAAGDYQAAFSYDAYRETFENDIYRHLEWLMKLLEERIRRGEDDVSAANGIHSEETLRSFYASVFQDQESASFTHSHSVCLGCLFERPEHTLPCGHMLCSVCVRSYGDNKNDLLVEMTHCPLEFDAPPLQRPIAVYLKPDAASSRVLSLDHGGIRSIIQLEILRMLEEEWQDKLSVRCFFDLIVGSGTGGLISLGLTTRGWSVKKCMFHVERILKQAFSKRSGRSLPGIGRLLETASKEKYDTAALEYALKEAFGEEDSLFGSLDARDSPASTSDVAVVASSALGVPILLASYNRRYLEPLPYTFRRPEKPDQELKLWEAARATMSTPKHFKPFFHEPTKQVYLAAPSTHLNPIYIADSERRIFKEDLRCVDAPDLIVSLGAGVEESLLDHSSCSSSMVSEIAHTCTCATVGRRNSRKHPKRHASFLRCQTTSDDFVHDFPSSATSHLRFVRFNPPASARLPSSDDLGASEDLRDTIKGHIDRNEVKVLAAKLLATLFYYEPLGNLAQQSDGTWLSTGKIRCRIPNDTAELCSLGKLIRKKSGSADPRFVIRDEEGTTKVLSVTSGITTDMIIQSRFAIPPIEIDVPQRSTIVDIMLFFENTDRNSISGFPRPLGKTQTKANRHRIALSSQRSEKASTRSSLQSRTTGRSWQPPAAVRTASPVPSDEVMFSPVAAGMTHTSRGRGRRGSQDNYALMESPIDPGYTDSVSASRSRSNSNARSTAPRDRRTQSRLPRQDSDQEMQRSPNFDTHSFMSPKPRNPSSSRDPVERPTSGSRSRGKAPAATSAPADSVVPQLDPRDVIRNVKMMSAGKKHPMDMKIMFGEDGSYDGEADILGRPSIESLKSSIESRNSGESVQQLEERLRQLESIIRSKERIDADQIRDSLKDEVLLGQGGSRKQKAT